MPFRDGGGRSHRSAGCKPTSMECLSNRAVFPVLHDLCTRGPHYQAYFLDSCSALSGRLESARAAGDLLPAAGQGRWWSDSQLRADVQETADTIRGLCASTGEERGGFMA